MKESNEISIHDGAYSLNKCPNIIQSSIESISTPGETILDPMAGRGAVVVEAMDMGRHALGVEIDKSVAEKANNYLRMVRDKTTSGKASILSNDSSKLSQFLKKKIDHAALCLPITLQIIDSETNAPIPVSCPATMIKIYEQCFKVLPKGGKLAVILHAYGNDKRLATETATLCRQAGFKLKGRLVQMSYCTSLWKSGDLKWDKSIDSVHEASAMIFEKRSGRLNRKRRRA